MYTRSDVWRGLRRFQLWIESLDHLQTSKIRQGPWSAASGIRLLPVGTSDGSSCSTIDRDTRHARELGEKAPKTWRQATLA